MNPSEQHDPEDLERRLREAFAAKALQISDADLDRDREDEVAAALSTQQRRHPATRWFAGIGAGAAAAAIIGVTFVGLQGGGQHEVVNGLPPATTASSSSTAPSSATTSAPSSSSGGVESPNRHPAYPDPDVSTTRPTAELSVPSSAPTSETGPSEESRTALSSGATLATNPTTSASMSISSQQPPAMPTSLPQSGTLDDREYSGAVPLEDPAGGAPRMLSMPSDLTWQRTAQTSNSLTVRITYLPTDIEAYWRQTLPGQGWVADGAGWKFPGTGYSVSPITDKGSFTVTW